MRKSPFLLLGLLALGANAQALDFNFITDGTMDPAALAGFKQAGSIWSGLFTDKVTINIKVGYQDLGNDSVIGQAGSAQNTYSYSSYRSGLIADKSSAIDDSATASLGAGATYQFVINGTSTSGANRATLGQSHFSSTGNVALTRANAKAVGLLAADDASVDSEITFNSRFAFDLDRSNGIDPKEMDFVGVAAHEIGHALGFVSGVDTLDYNFARYYFDQTGTIGLFDDAAFGDSHSSLDMFRYANYGSAAAPRPLRDWTLGNYTSNLEYVPYLSVDGGKTRLGGMSAGAYTGDGSQASHWLDDYYGKTLLGIMDPNTDFGNFMKVSQNDINAFDAIGWNVKPVPEPATLAALGLGAAAFLRRRKRA